MQINHFRKYSKQIPTFILFSKLTNQTTSIVRGIIHYQLSPSCLSCFTSFPILRQESIWVEGRGQNGLRSFRSILVLVGSENIIYYFFFQFYFDGVPYRALMLSSLILLQLELSWQKVRSSIPFKPPVSDIFFLCPLASK